MFRNFAGAGGGRGWGLLGNDTRERVQLPLADWWVTEPNQAIRALIAHDGIKETNLNKYRRVYRGTSGRKERHQPLNSMGIGKRPSKQKSMHRRIDRSQRMRFKLWTSHRLVRSCSHDMHILRRYLFLNERHLHPLRIHTIFSSRSSSFASIRTAMNLPSSWL